MTKSNKLTIARKTGAEQFHSNGKSLGFSLESFWQWSCSDIISNATRGILAEYLVARALGLGKSGVRDEWSVNDLQTISGITIQVKSSAYIQSWHQEKPSQIIFNVEKTRSWDPDTNILSKNAKRSSDLYVFAVLAHKDKSTIDPLNIDQWQFYVLPTKVLGGGSQKSITLKSLEKLCSAVNYDDLGKAIEDLGASIKQVKPNKMVAETSKQKANIATKHPEKPYYQKRQPLVIKRKPKRIIWGPGQS